MRDALDQTRRMLEDRERRRTRRRQLLEGERIVTVANGFSLVRLALLPFILACMLVREPFYDALALLLLVVAALTDFMDGWVARKLNQTSQLGRIIDPVADKLFVGALGVILVFLRDLPVWFVGLYLLRDFLIICASYLLFLNRDIVLSPNPVGKATTVVLMSSLVAYTLSWQPIGQYLVTIGGVLVVISGLLYLNGFIRLLSTMLRSDSPDEVAAQPLDKTGT